MAGRGRAVRIGKAKQTGREKPLRRREMGLMETSWMMGNVSEKVPPGPGPRTPVDPGPGLRYP
jgi:hypothetical protein